jgi:nucleotide-binding universal stress UspA family protein
MNLNFNLQNVLIVFDGDGSAAEHIRQFVGIDSAAQNLIAVHMDPNNEHAGSIVSMAEDYRSDFIVMALHEAGPEGDHGAIRCQVTVGEEVALTAGIPVMMLRSEMIAGIQSRVAVSRILVPIDGSIVSKEIVPIAAMLSAQFEAPIHFITVIDPVTTLPAAYAYLPTSNLDRQEALVSLQREANGALDIVERNWRLAGVEVSTELLLGPTVDCLLAAIGSGDIIAMTTHGEGNASRSKLGSMALHLLRNSPVPVVLLPSASCVVNGQGRASWDIRTPDYPTAASGRSAVR